jgi:hypothetical protein
MICDFTSTNHLVLLYTIRPFVSVTRRVLFAVSVFSANSCNCEHNYIFATYPRTEAVCWLSFWYNDGDGGDGVGFYTISSFHLLNEL